MSRLLLLALVAFCGVLLLPPMAIIWIGCTLACSAVVVALVLSVSLDIRGRHDHRKD